jgi:hypothetical protein
MVDEAVTETRRGAADKAEMRPSGKTPPHEHAFTAVIDNPVDPPKREVCEICATARPVSQ